MTIPNTSPSSQSIDEFLQLGPIDSWTTQDVVELLRYIEGCDIYVNTFQENAIDGRALLNLTMTTCIERPLLMNWGHAAKLIFYVNQIKAGLDPNCFKF